MGMSHQSSYIFQRIAGCCTCAKLRRTDIHCIRTVVNSFNATFHVFGRGQ